MITTITLNPAIDRILYIGNFQENQINRVSSVRVYPGGKGINVGRIARLLGTEVIISGVIAGINGAFIEETLKLRGFDVDFIRVSGETRINTKIYDNIKEFTTDINEPGPYIRAEEIRLLKDKIKTLAEKSNVMVFAGSIPGGLPKDIYRQLIEIASKEGCKTILDCDGESLKEGIKANPYLIKPNVHELEGILDVKLNSGSDIIDAAVKLVENGVNTVVVSMGVKGAYVIEKNVSYFAEAVPVRVKGTVGAGDSMAGAFAHTIDSSDPLEKGLVLAISASAACVKAGSASDLDSASLVEYLDRVRYRKIQ